MSGVQTVTVGAGEGDQRLDRWLKRRFPQLTQGRIEKACRKGEIRVDGGRVKPATRVEAGQSVRVPPLPDEAPPAPPERSRISERDAEMMRAAVLFRDDHVIALNKPPGLRDAGRQRPGPPHRRPCRGAEASASSEKPRLVHRLDKRHLRHPAAGPHPRKRKGADRGLPRPATRARSTGPPSRACRIRAWARSATAS
jgi:23S rRNA pseudouridine955/2504/2580 synthase